MQMRVQILGNSAMYFEKQQQRTEKEKPRLIGRQEMPEPSAVKGTQLQQQQQQ